jgi:hypothetical protein
VVRSRELRARLEVTESSWIARGFGEVASNELTAASTITAELPGSSCFVATDTADGPIRVRSGDSRTEGRGSVAWCACDPTRATIEGSAGSAPTGLAVLRVEARILGGPLARAWLDFAPGAWGEGGNECAESVLDDWIADRRWPPPALDEGWFDASAERASLRRAGFRVASAIASGRPFAVVEAAAHECHIALTDAKASLSLRATGGAMRVSKAQGALAWCNASAVTSSVWREGDAAVVILSASATRVGGLLGTRECAADAGLTIAPSASWLGDEDLASDAADVLRASTLAEVTPNPLPAVPGTADLRIVGLSLSTNASVASDPAAVAVACDPRLDPEAGSRETVCAQAAPVAWWHTTDAPAGAARAPLPAWLSPLESHREPDAIARIPELLSLARRLSREGFEPTMLEGVSELFDGVRVVGRAGEDAIVAVGIGQKAPWLFPFTNGLPWDLGDRPVVVALKPGDSVKLTTSPPPNSPLDRRRTVVFRHSASSETKR